MHVALAKQNSNKKIKKSLIPQLTYKALFNKVLKSWTIAPLPIRHHKVNTSLLRNEQYNSHSVPIHNSCKTSIECREQIRPSGPG